MKIGEVAYERLPRRLQEQYADGEDITFDDGDMVPVHLVEQYGSASVVVGDGPGQVTVEDGDVFLNNE